MWRVAVLLLVLTGPAWAGELDVSWTAPTTDTAGGPIVGPLTYHVYWFLFPATPCPGTQFLVTQPGVTAIKLTALTQGMTYNVQVTALNSAGLESPCSPGVSAAARADTPLGVGTNLQIAFVPGPPPAPTTFSVVGVASGQVVTGLLRVQAIPLDGTTDHSFTFTMKNAAGTNVRAPNTEGGAPYCFIGDPGALPCTAFNTTTVANGSYSMQIVHLKGGVTTTQTILFTIGN